MAKAVCVDTNIVVHFLLGNDKTLLLYLKEEVVHIPSQVWIETMYVLEKVYRLERSLMTAKLRDLLTIQSVACDKDLVERILNLMDEHHNLSPVDCFLADYVVVHDLQLVTKDKKLDRFISQLSSK